MQQPLEDCGAVLAERLERLDKYLIDNQVPIPDRPFNAAWRLVKSGAVKVKGGIEKGFVQTPWFAAILRMTLAWYREKYQQGLSHQDDPLIGVCLHNGAALELRIPKTLKKIEKEGKTSWLIFPYDLQNEDRPKTWIVRPPNLKSMDSRERTQLLSKVVKIGSCLRAIYLNLMTAEKPDSIAEGLTNSILPHLAISAEQILAPQQRTLNLACWEAHQAAESSLKLLSRQRRGKHEPTHELKRLYDKISGLQGIRISSSLISKLPTGREVIKMRANEGQPRTLSEAYRIYFAALWLVKQCTAAMPRKYVVRNARILLKKPDWLD
jgi:HEPN domain-containing protein